MVVDIAALQGSADLATDQVLQPGGVRARDALGTEHVESLSLALERYPLCFQVNTQCTVDFQDTREPWRRSVSVSSDTKDDRATKSTSGFVALMRATAA